MRLGLKKQFMELKTEQIEASRLQKLAEDRSNVVYEYTHDAPGGWMAPQAQAETLRDLVASFDYLCRQKKKASDEEIRERIMQANAKFRMFQQLYPMVFANVTIRVLDDSMSLRLDKIRKLSMMFIVERWKGEGDDDTRHARAMHTAMRLSMREHGSADTITPEGVIASDVKMTPMLASEFGETTVNQK